MHITSRDPAAEHERASASAPAVAVVGRARRLPRRRRALMVAGLTLMLGLVIMVRTLLGDYTITAPDFVRIVAGTHVPGADYILLDSKLPRAVLGVLVGMAFGTGGAIFQSTLRNPLASPDIIGISAGASAAAVFGIVILGLHGRELAVAAVIGALLVGILVRWQAGSSHPSKLILGGIGVSAALQSVVQYLFTRADEHDANTVLHWLTGSLNAADWTTIAGLSVVFAVLAPVLVWLAGSHPVAELGTDIATGLGVPAGRSQLLQLVGVVLVALGVAAAGPVAFVAFLSGPIARYLNGGRTTLVGAALTGAVILVGADHLAAYLIPDVNLPVGVVTGAVGAPFLLWLLATGRTRRST